MPMVYFLQYQIHSKHCTVLRMTNLKQYFDIATVAEQSVYGILYYDL